MDGADDGRSRSYSQRTKGVACHAIAYIVRSRVNRRSAASCFNAGKHLHHPARSFAAWRAFAARFILIKLHETMGHFYHIGSIIHDDDRSGTKSRFSALPKFQSPSKYRYRALSKESRKSLRIASFKFPSGKHSSCSSKTSRKETPKGNS